MRRKRLAPWLKGRQRRDVSLWRLALLRPVRAYLRQNPPLRRRPRMRGDRGKGS
jgi:hypothetical protein